METIAPLARVLAEANGIEWRSLSGTGDGGMITETDILGYLARVMSGEEDAPTTPVDPMPSPAELAVYSSPEMLSRAGVEPELAEFLKAQQDQIHEAVSAPSISVPEVAAPSLPEVAAPVMEEEPELVPEVSVPDITVDAPTEALPVAAEADFSEPEDEFELEEESMEAEVPEPVVLEPMVPVTEEPVAAEPVAAESIPEVPAVQEPVAAPEPVMPPPMPQAPARPASGGLLSGLLSSLYRRNDAPVQPAPTRPLTPPPATIAPSMPVMPAAAALPEVAKPVTVVPEPGVQPAAAADLPEPELAAHADVVPPISTDLSTEERVLPPAPVLGEVIAPDTAEPAQFVPAEPEVLPVPMPEPQMPSVAASAEPSQPTPSQTVPSHSVPTMPASAWAGTYLRREVDLSAMQSAREQLSDLIGDLPLSLMLARAAQRHLGLLDLSSVAVANVSGEALHADLSGDLRSGLKALSNAQPGGSADLLILDAGELDLDDLHYPHAVTLSLGRVQNGKAALSLNGNLDVQQAARFLAEVSALLAAPVKLLV